MRIGFLLFILGLSVTASAQMYRVGGTSRASFGSQQTEETAAPATRTFSSYGARRQRTQSANTQPSAPTAQTDSSATQQAAPATTGNTAPQTPSSAKADKNAGKNQKADPKEGEKKEGSDQQAQAAVSQVQAMMNSFGLSAPQTGVPQAEGKNDKKAGSRGNNSRAGSANSNASSSRGGSANKGTDAGAATPGVPDMSAIMQAASSGQMPDLSALMGGQSSGKK